MTPGDEMLDAADPEQIISEALTAGGPRVERTVGDVFHDYDWTPREAARESLAALHSNGVLVFSSEADVWAFVRERVEKTGHAGNRWRIVAAALDAAERGTDA